MNEEIILLVADYGVKEAARRLKWKNSELYAYLRKHLDREKQFSWQSVCKAYMRERGYSFGKLRMIERDCARFNVDEEIFEDI